MDDEGTGGQFDEILGAERMNDCCQVRQQECLEIGVADVPGRDQQQLRGRVGNDERMDEVSILGNNHPVLAVGNPCDLMIARPVPIGQIQRVVRVVTSHA